MNNIKTNNLYIIGSIIQLIVAWGVSQKQSQEIKKNAQTTKFIQLGFAAFVFMMGIIQTMTIINKIISTCKGK